jgi:acylphosphatase
VQGVYFRQHTYERAQELGIKGFVKNQPDGSVYCEAEGDAASLQHFLDWCGIGSPMSDVRSVEVQSHEKMGYNSFEIQR